jgi:nucleoside-diphosphate-sugar epimerase
MDTKILVIGHTGFIGMSVLEHSLLSHQVVDHTDFPRYINDKAELLKRVLQLEPSVILFFAGSPSWFGESEYQTKIKYKKNKDFQDLVFQVVLEYGRAQFIYAGSSIIYDYFPNSIGRENEIDFDINIKYQSENYCRVKFEGLKFCHDNYLKGYPFTGIVISNTYGINEIKKGKSKSFISQAVNKIYASKIYDLSQVKMQGNSNNERDFLFISDLIKALNIIIFSPRRYPIINIGSGFFYKVSKITSIIADCFEYSGHVIFEKSIPESVTRKKMDISLLENLGWESRVTPKQGLAQVCNDFLKSIDKFL